MSIFLSPVVEQDNEKCYPRIEKLKKQIAMG